ncbi:hypothetical protein BaRGS_00006985 [Batillaria attramentaria]|uniref:Uncharacterized protein n=1 Tax=Batillaria attramentaria TaxID=370345 RepID=A0ABD0LQT6_9CAEN
MHYLLTVVLVFEVAGWVDFTVSREVGDVSYIRINGVVLRISKQGAVGYSVVSPSARVKGCYFPNIFTYLVSRRPATHAPLKGSYPLRGETTLVLAPLSDLFSYIPFYMPAPFVVKVTIRKVQTNRAGENVGRLFGRVSPL